MKGCTEHIFCLMPLMLVIFIAGTLKPVMPPDPVLEPTVKNEARVVARNSIVNHWSMLRVDMLETGEWVERRKLGMGGTKME